MNTDFPRILSLLRKEKGLSQKQAAADLGIAQALLSHYEKGKRECGLEFLVKAADYYNVSTDYLLGRSAVSSGAVLGETDIPEADSDEKNRGLNSLSLSLSKKLLISSIDIIYSLLAKTKNAKLVKSVSDILMLTIYRVFRLTYRANPKNDPKMFGISDDSALRAADAGIALAEGRAISSVNASSGETEDAPLITTAYLESEYQKQAAVLLNMVKNSENQLKSFEL